MTTISGNLTIDEAVINHGANQNDVDYATWASAHSTLVGQLGTHTLATQTGFPQVAERDDMIDFSTASGLALSITGGGVTDFTDLAGHAITLTADSSNPNIILGVGSDNQVSFAVILDVVDNGATIASAKVYVVQYEALYNKVAGQIDSLDTLSLAGLISLDITTTTFESHFEPLNFAAIPSGSPQETLTVPTTSPTDNHSITFNGLVFPTGAVADPTSVAINPGTNDDLNPDAIGFGVKGGQASQMNQNEGFFAQDSTWATTGAEINGLRFDIQGVGGVKKVNVEYWLVDEGAVVAHDVQSVNLPSGNNVYDNFTIQSATSFDQVYVRFYYDDKIDTSGVRIENFETLVTSQTEVSTTTHEDLGTHVIFQDDGPTIGAQSDSQVDFHAGAFVYTALTNVSPGVDGTGEVYLTTLPNGWTYDANPNDPTPTLHNSATDSTGTFNIAVDNDSYTFTVLKDPVLTFQPLDFSAIPSGSPQETLTVPTTSPTDNHSITFNGLIFPTGAVADPTSVAINPGTNDDLNPDAIGFGVKGGQASQLNQNEGFFAQDSTWATTGAEINGLRFDIQGVGGVKKVNVEYWLVDEGAVVAHDVESVNLPSGNNVYDNFTIHSDTSFDQVYVRFYFDDKIDTSGVRIENFETQVPNPVPDQQFTFGVNMVDGDLDPAVGTSFKVSVDGNHDGTILL
ncbi:hypothetical protein [Alsobacter sp. SYSU BS001988]